MPGIGCKTDLISMDKASVVSTRAVRTIAIAGCVLASLLYVAEWFEATTTAYIGNTGTPYWSMDEASPPVQNQVRALSSSHKVDFDTRNRIDVVSEMRERYPITVSAVAIGSVLANQSLGEGRSIDASKLLPIGGISNRLTVLCNESGQYVTFDSDEHGFRNPPGVWNQHPADVAVVGESFVQGYCVPNGKSFVDLLRAAYPATLNLGMSGESALLQLAAIKEYLPRYMPKIVLWVYCEDIDIGDLFEEVKQPLVMRYLNPDSSQNLISRQNEIDSALRGFVAQEEESRHKEPQHPAESGISRSLGILKLWHLRGMLAAARATDEAQRLETFNKWYAYRYRETVEQAKTLTQSWGGTLYFVYLPSWRRYHHHAAATELEHTTILRMIERLHIPYIDVEPEFEATSDPLSLFPFRRFGHYTEEGNKLVADTILRVLSKRRTTN